MILNTNPHSSIVMKNGHIRRHFNLVISHEFIMYTPYTLCTLTPPEMNRVETR